MLCVFFVPKEFLDGRSVFDGASKCVAHGFVVVDEEALAIHSSWMDEYVCDDDEFVNGFLGDDAFFDGVHDSLGGAGLCWTAKEAGLVHTAIGHRGD